MKTVSRWLSFCIAIAAFGTLTACGQGTESSRSERRAIATAQAIATDFLTTELALSPETASRLKLQRFLGPSTIYTLDNHSQGGFERKRLVRIELLQRLQARPRLPDGHPLERDLNIAEQALQDIVALEQLGYGRFDYASLRPYAIDPFSGIWIAGPTLLSYRQSIDTPEDARAYINRLSELSAAIHDVRRRLIADEAAGIILPRHLASETLARLDRLLNADIGGIDQLSASFAALSRDIDGLAPNDRKLYLAAIETEISTRLRPAYTDLAGVLKTLSDGEDEQSGIWAQPRGEMLFNGILTASLGESIESARLHESHLTQSNVLRSRWQSISPSPAAAASNELAETPASSVQPGLSNSRSVEGEPEDSVLRTLAPKRTWDRVRAAQYSPVSTADLENVFTNTAAQVAFETERSDRVQSSSSRALIQYPAIVEGWQLYIWQTMGSNQNDENANAAASQFLRLVQVSLAAVDTGIHLERWSIAEATEYILINTGLSEELSSELALTVSARPGHHSASQIAALRFEALAERARAVLGDQYSERDFQSVMIGDGPRPLNLIERDIETWYGDILSGRNSN